MRIETSKESMDLASTVATIVDKFSPQLYRRKGNSDSNPRLVRYASAVLFKVSDRYFAITAGHNYSEENSMNVGVKIDGQLISFGQKMALYEPNNEQNYNPANYDFAVFELDAYTADRLSVDYNFLDWTLLARTHINGSTLYLVFGYPQNKTTYNKEKKIRESEPIIYGAREADEIFYKDANLDSSRTLILDYKQKKALHGKAGLIQRLTKQYGISGCGIWSIDVFNTRKNVCELVAIVTGQNESKTALYSTKISNLSMLMKLDF